MNSKKRFIVETNFTIAETFFKAWLEKHEEIKQKKLKAKDSAIFKPTDLASLKKTRTLVSKFLLPRSEILYAAGPLSFNDSFTAVSGSSLYELGRRQNAMNRRTFIQTCTANLADNKTSVLTWQTNMKACHADPRWMTHKLRFLAKTHDGVAKQVMGTEHDFGNNNYCYHRQRGFVDYFFIQPGRYYVGPKRALTPLSTIVERKEERSTVQPLENQPSQKQTATKTVERPSTTPAPNQRTGRRKGSATASISNSTTDPMVEIVEVFESDYGGSEQRVLHVGTCSDVYYTTPEYSKPFDETSIFVVLSNCCILIGFTVLFCVGNFVFTGHWVTQPKLRDRNILDDYKKKKYNYQESFILLKKHCQYSEIEAHLFLGKPDEQIGSMTLEGRIKDVKNNDVTVLASQKVKVDAIMSVRECKKKEKLSEREKNSNLENYNPSQGDLFFSEEQLKRDYPF